MKFDMYRIPKGKARKETEAHPKKIGKHANWDEG